MMAFTKLLDAFLGPLRIGELYWHHPTNEALRRNRRRTGGWCLDGGCESGAALQALNKEVAPPGRIGLDINVEACTRFRNARPIHGDSCLASCAVCGDLTAIPLVDSSMDLVICRSVLQYLDIPKAAAEIKRVLKPEGTVIIVSNLPYNPFVCLFRRVGKTKKQNRSIRGYYSPETIAAYFTQTKNFYHSEYHVFTPLLLPLRFLLPWSTTLLIIGWAVAAEKAVMRIVPRMRRFGWYTYLEIPV